MVYYSGIVKILKLILHCYGEQALGLELMHEKKQLENSNWSTGFAKPKFPQYLSFKQLLLKSVIEKLCFHSLSDISLQFNDANVGTPG